jgi:ABC-type multidrug transport system fused ATPase/permease subunit
MKKKINKQIVFWKSTFSLLGKYKKKYIYCLLGLMLIKFQILLPPLFIGLIVNFITKYNSKKDSLLPFYIYSVSLGLSFIFASYFRLQWKKKIFQIMNSLEYSINTNGFNQLLNNALTERHNITGKAFQRLINGVDGIKNMNSMLQGKISTAAAILIGMVCVLSFISVEYLILIFLYLFIFIYILFHYQNKIKQLNINLNFAIETSSSTFLESLRNANTIKLLGKKNKFQDFVAGNERQKKNISDSIVSMLISQWNYFHLLNGIMYIISILYIGHAIIEGNMLIGSIVILLSYLDKLIDSGGEILVIYFDMIKAKSKIEMMLPLFKIDPKKNQGTLLFPSLWKSITIENADFSYKTKDREHLVFSNINIDIKKGEKIGIIGKTGSGKSTLAKILLGIYPLTKGKYCVDRNDFYSIDHDEVLKNMTIVLQEPEIFNLSFKENIILFESYDSNKFNNAIQMACLKDVIEKLSEGINSIIGEKGYTLSGGEKQRIGIARAIYKNSVITIFDEATSSLDASTENKIIFNINKEFRDSTVIFITHNHSLFKNITKLYSILEKKI